jgi:hypothetical protein
MDWQAFGLLERASVRQPVNDWARPIFERVR